MSNLHPLKVVDRDSETQLQVGELFLMWRFNGEIPITELMAQYNLTLCCTGVRSTV